MNNAKCVSRGDRNRTLDWGRLRELVPLDPAIVRIGLADKEQMLVVTDPDSRVLARHTSWCKAWDLGGALDWLPSKRPRTGSPA
jgi:hypothetical protein